MSKEQNNPLTTKEYESFKRVFKGWDVVFGDNSVTVSKGSLTKTISYDDLKRHKESMKITF